MTTEKERTLLVKMDTRISVMEEVLNRLETNHLVHIEKDISTDGYALRLQYEGTNKPCYKISGSMYNTGGTVTTNNFVWQVRTGSSADCTGTTVDDTVTNSLLDNNTPSALPNEFKLTMH